MICCVWHDVMVNSFLSGGLLSCFDWSTVPILSFAPLPTAFLPRSAIQPDPIARQI